MNRRGPRTETSDTPEDSKNFNDLNPYSEPAVYCPQDKSLENKWS